MNERLLKKLKQLSNKTVKIDRDKEEVVSPPTIKRTRGSRNRNESSKKQNLKAQIKDLDL